MNELWTVVLSLETRVAVWKGTKEMLLMVEVQVLISVPSDHCEYM